MTRYINLSKEQRLAIEHKPGIPVLECHLEQINKNGHWNGRAWFYITRGTLEELLAEMDAK